MTNRTPTKVYDEAAKSGGLLCSRLRRQPHDKTISLP